MRKGFTIDEWIYNSRTNDVRWANVSYQKLRLFPSASDFLRSSLVLIYFPQIAWAGLIATTAIISFQIMLGTVSMVFGTVPYNFGTQCIGLTYVGPVTGTCLRCIYSGPIWDWFYIQLARRRKGMHEAENFLYLGLFNIFSNHLALSFMVLGPHIHFTGLVQSSGWVWWNLQWWSLPTFDTFTP